MILRLNGCSSYKISEFVLETETWTSNNCANDTGIVCVNLSIGNIGYLNN